MAVSKWWFVVWIDSDRDVELYDDFPDMGGPLSEYEYMAWPYPLALYPAESSLPARSTEIPIWPNLKR